MKTIGLLGGMTWESTHEYYRIINQQVNKRLGKHHAAQIAMTSINIQEMEDFINKGDFAGLTEFFIKNAKKVEAAGADCLLICANTPHMFADVIQQSIAIPLIHITDATAEHIKVKGLSKIGLLGTTATMEQGFYKVRLKNKHAIESLIPEEDERNFIQKVIVNELFAGVMNPVSRNKIISIMQSLTSKGAQGIILGCTEIPLLIKQTDTDIILFDTSEIHACAAVDFALS